MTLEKEKMVIFPVYLGPNICSSYHLRFTAKFEVGILLPYFMDEKNEGSGNLLKGIQTINS